MRHLGAAGTLAVSTIDAQWRVRLDAGVGALGLSINAAARQRLLEYLALLVQWNAAYNLTAVRDPLQMIDRHLIDALSLLPHLQPTALADIGTGPGIPGMVLALVQPFERVWLVDSNGKKIRFLRECLRRFELPHVHAKESRAEALPGNEPFPQIVSRAYSSLSDFVTSTHQLLAPDGRWLAMKGKRPDDEIAALPRWAKVERIDRLDVPGVDGERHLVVLGSA